MPDGPATGLTFALGLLSVLGELSCVTARFSCEDKMFVKRRTEIDVAMGKLKEKLKTTVKLLETPTFLGSCGSFPVRSPPASSGTGCAPA